MNMHINKKKQFSLRISGLYILLFFTLFLCGCKEEKEIEPIVPGEAVSSAPQWKVDPSFARLPYSMTLICLPSLNKQIIELNEKDEIGVFLNNKCCGVASFKDIEERMLAFVAPAIDTPNTQKLEIRFFRKSTMRIYKSKELIDFVLDSSLGLQSKPYIIEVE